MSIAFLLPFLCALIGLAAVGRFLVYRADRHDLGQALLHFRKFDIRELECLLDAGEEWTLRRCLTPQAFRRAQQARAHLLREYLRRVAHNTNVIQRWALAEHELIKNKDRSCYTEKDMFVADVLQIAVELRLYSFVALAQLRFRGTAGRLRWPPAAFPSLVDVRKQCGVDVLAKYGRLVEIVGSLSLAWGVGYHERLGDVL